MTHFNPASNHSSPKSAFSAHAMSAEQKQLEKLYKLTHKPKNINAFEPSTALKNGLQKMGQSLIQFFTDTQQVRIWTKETSKGTVWFAYDPMLDRSISRVSEDDLRTWIEARYHK